MNYFIIMNNIAVPKEDQIYSIQKCQSKSVSSYLTQVKNSHGQDSYSIYADSLMKLFLHPSVCLAPFW